MIFLLRSSPQWNRAGSHLERAQAKRQQIGGQEDADETIDKSPQCSSDDQRACFGGESQE
jgi:hypothetical protein